MPTVSFSHPNLSTLVIDNGMDDVRWGYNLNTAVFPTYGGEVIQILSVYIDDLTLQGTCATYQQAEAIYRFFASYMQIASQGKGPGAPRVGNSISGSAYNLLPVVFSYPHRGWQFNIYPREAAGFTYGLEVVAPLWQLVAHVVDSSPDLDLIKKGIAAAAVGQNQNGPITTSGQLSLNGEISPHSGDPDSDPFQTYNGNQSSQQIGNYSTYYNNVVNAYAKGDFSSITGLGSQPANPNTKTKTNSKTQKGHIAPSNGQGGIGGRNTNTNPFPRNSVAGQDGGFPL